MAGLAFIENPYISSKIVVHPSETLPQAEKQQKGRTGNRKLRAQKPEYACRLGLLSAKRTHCHQHHQNLESEEGSACSVVTATR